LRLFLNQLPVHELDLVRVQRWHAHIVLDDRRERAYEERLDLLDERVVVGIEFEAEEADKV